MFTEVMYMTLQAYFAQPMYVYTYVLFQRVTFSKTSKISGSMSVLNTACKINWK